MINHLDRAHDKLMQSSTNYKSWHMNDFYHIKNWLLFGIAIIATFFLVSTTIKNSELGLALATSLPPDTIIVPPKTAPLNGTFFSSFINYGDIAPDNIPSYFDELKSIGMDTVIIVQTRWSSGNLNWGNNPQKGKCDNPNYVWMDQMPDLLNIMLSEADARGMSIYVGLTGVGDNGCKAQDVDSDGVPEDYADEPNRSHAIKDVDWATKFIVDNYGQHPSLKGWYLPEEPPITFWYTVKESTYLTYYKQYVDTIKKYSNKPILIAPGIAWFDDSLISPTELAARTLRFKNATNIDLFLYQDGMGGRLITSPNHGWAGDPYLTAYFVALSNAIGRNALWVDHEIFNCCNAYQGSAAIDRFKMQVQAIPDTLVSGRVVWIQQYQMTGISPLRQPDSKRLLAEYKATYGIEGEQIKNATVEWITPPASNYPDNGNELFDNIIGDPLIHWQNEWVGVLGSAEGIVDLGSTKQVTWVSAHVMNSDTAWIFFPSSLVVSCSTDKITWQPGFTQSFSHPNKRNAEYVVSNLDPVNLQCRYIKFKLLNTGWTFISELEIVGVSNPKLSLAITAPSSGATVSGSNVAITAIPTSNIGATGVQFKVDDNNLGSEDTTSPYSIIWNTNDVMDGSHTLSAIVRDASGATKTTSTTVNVSNPNSPALSLLSPSSGSTISGNTTISVKSGNPQKFLSSGVQFKVDNVNLGLEQAVVPDSCDFTCTYIKIWDTTQTPNGSHTITAVVRDSVGNTQSLSSTVIVNNISSDITPPTVNITAPLNGGTISGKNYITVSASASDNVGVVGVRFLIDGTNLGSEDLTSPYAVSLKPSDYSKGNHTISAIARDAAGNTKTTSITVNRK